MIKRTALIVLLVFFIFGMSGNLVFADSQEDLKKENEALKRELNRMKLLFEKNETTTVSGSGSDTESKEKTVLEEVKVTAPPVEKPLKDFAGTVHTISKEEIEKKHPSHVGELLKRVPGLNVVDEYGTGIKPNYGFRGLAPFRSKNTILLLDDIPIQPSVYGDPSSYYNVPVQRLDRIEVIKGGASVKYGPNTMGGIVNHKSREIPEGSELRTHNTIGSDNLIESNTSYSGQLGSMDFMMDYLRREGEGFRDNMRFDVDDFTTKLVFHPDMQSSLTFNFNYYDVDEETPGGVTVQQFKDDPDQASKPFDFFEGERFSVDAHYRRQFTKDSSLNTILYGNFFERNWYIADQLGSSATTNTQFLRKFNAFGIEPSYSIRYHLGNIKNLLMVGGRLHLDRESDVRARGTTANSRIGKTDQDADLETFALATYIENEFIITDRLSITPGFRWERVELSRDNRLRGAGGGVAGENTAREFLPAIGITYKLTDETTLFASARRNFQPAEFSEAVDPTTGTNTDLDAAIGKNFEIGVRSRPLKWFYSELTFFRMNFDNQIITVDGVLQNAQGTRHRGVEGSLEIDLFELISAPFKKEIPAQFGSLSTNFNFTFLDTEFNSGAFSGNSLPQAPDKKYGWGVEYDNPLGFSANLDGLWVDKQFSNDANTRQQSADGITGKIPQYRLWDLHLAYAGKIKKQEFSIFGGIKNLFDEEYFTRRSSGTQSGIIPSPDRTFYTGFEFKM